MLRHSEHGVFAVAASVVPSVSTTNEVVTTRLQNQCDGP